MPGRPLKRPGAITFKNSERVESRVCCARLHQTPRRRVDSVLGHVWHIIVAKRQKGRC
ncbi:hypothetical protein ALC62_08021 [Cyphomyrmex costatus]|uniref:Uncharacterized protein n=1 Tax=Cyphomyrmex costatus TaxID=456900 RepID=A0A195CM71_9HYME|nr:hypothetical protein ALC62_08021 [Cyphomyrmex costatus]